jgi:hypothetical protein
MQDFGRCGKLASLAEVKSAYRSNRNEETDEEIYDTWFAQPEILQSVRRVLPET